MQTYTTEQANQLLVNILSNSYAKDNQQPVIKPSMVSKIIFERYINAEVGTIKLFLYSEGSRSNNKPFIYNKQVTIDKFSNIDKCLMVLLRDSKDDNSLDDLLGDNEEPEENFELPCEVCGEVSNGLHCNCTD